MHPMHSGADLDQGPNALAIYRRIRRVRNEDLSKCRTKGSRIIRIQGPGISKWEYDSSRVPSPLASADNILQWLYVKVAAKDTRS